MSYKQFSEMTEALAERLLDLHCRLLTLYIIQDADCLHWESQQPFFESERGSYTIQMWWLYMMVIILLEHSINSKTCIIGNSPRFMELSTTINGNKSICRNVK